MWRENLHGDIPVKNQNLYCKRRSNQEATFRSAERKHSHFQITMPRTRIVPNDSGPCDCYCSALYSGKSGRWVTNGAQSVTARRRLQTPHRARRRPAGTTCTRSRTRCQSPPQSTTSPSYILLRRQRLQTINICCLPTTSFSTARTPTCRQKKRKWNCCRVSRRQQASGLTRPCVGRSVSK